MPIRNKGLKELIKKFKIMPQAIADETRLTLKRGGKRVVKEARSNHRYNNPPHMITSNRQYSPSGNLDRSISSEVIEMGRFERIALRVYLNPVFITNNGVNYGVVQHDGMGSGYSPSPISPGGGTTGRNNLQHDWFLYNAWKKKLPGIEKSLKKVPERAKRKAGL